MCNLGGPIIRNLQLCVKLAFDYLDSSQLVTNARLPGNMFPKLSSPPQDYLAVMQTTVSYLAVEDT
jgi:hypothetical protein